MNLWKERWINGKTGWHGSEVNSNLIKHIHSIEPLNNAKILVPLCGKSLDMEWLAAKGASVVGVDLVREPLEQIFQDRNSVVQEDSIQGIAKLSDETLTVFHANIFDFNLDIDGPFDIIYDRAALVALSPENRERYVNHSLELLKPNGRILLITYDAPKKDLEGPPFPVRKNSVPTLFSAASQCTLLNQYTVTSDEEPRLKERNLDWSRTEVWLITK